jgi:MFS family permease
MANGSLCFTAPLSSALIDHFSVRTAMMTGGLLYTIGFLSTAFAPNISLSVLTFGVIAGESDSVIYV